MRSDEESRDGAAGGSPVVRVPGSVNRPDPILAGLTAGQLIVLAVVAAGCWAAYSATRTVVPPLAAAAAGTVIGGVAFAVVTLRRDGVGVDRLAVAFARYLRAPRRLAPAPGRPVPAWAGLPGQPGVGALRLPVSGIDAGGVLDLGADGAAVVCAASTLNLGLRTPAEQDAVAAAYAGWLNSLTGPVQLIIRADRVELDPVIAGLEDQAADLPDPGLETAALAHAGFLRDLAAEGDLLRRQVLLVLREPLPPATGRSNGPAGRAAIRTRVRQRAGETVAALTAAGIAVTVLDGTAAAVLAAAADPSRPPPPPGRAPAGAPITGACNTGAGPLPETPRR